MALRSGVTPKLRRGIVIGLLGAALSLLPWALGWLDAWEAKTWDWRATLLAEPGKASDDICLILLDQKSLDWAKEENDLTWPWPREIYGAIVNFCRRSGAKSLAFDVLFTEPSKYGVGDDEAFGAAVADHGGVVFSAFFSNKSGNLTQWPKHAPLPTFTIQGLDQWLKQPDINGKAFSRAIMPVEELSAHAALICNVHLRPGPDGIYRQLQLFSTFDGKLLPSLGLGAYLAAHPNAFFKILPNKLIIDQKTIPIDSGGKAILRYRGPSGTHKNFSAAAVLQSEIQIRNGETPNIEEPRVFEGKYVFFGFSAPGLYDLRSVPVAGIYPGVEIYATMLDNFLSGDFMRPTPAGFTTLLAFLLALACALAVTYFSSPAQSIALGLLFLAAPILACLGAYAGGFWLPLVVLESACLVTLGLVMVANYSTEGRQRRFIKNAFKHFLSPDVIEQLIANPGQLKLGGERKTLSIFFSDLQGFTSLSEGMDPGQLTAILNDYLSAMTEIIHKEGGTIDKYEGDAIIAFWNAPLDIEEHALRAVRAALRCQAKLEDMRPEFRQRTGEDLRMRIGINTGPAVVGNMGSHARFDYTVLGDAVNLAARLEGANKQFGTYTMISRSTRDLLHDEFATRELARLAVIGRSEAVVVYEPMFHDEYDQRKIRLETFNEALSLYYSGRFKRALETFARIQNFDSAADAYVEKCKTCMASEIKDWQGLWIMDRK